MGATKQRLLEQEEEGNEADARTLSGLWQEIDQGRKGYR